ncbi:MAG: N-acetyltransferase [Synechococcus sp.]|nr:N-acetyltransferase [Synechococcus sp.]
MTTIRNAIDLDQQVISQIYQRAFPDHEGKKVAALALDLLTEPTTPPCLSLVAEVGGNVVGHIAFSPVALTSSDNDHGYILAPLAVEPTYQKRHLGSQLVETSIRYLKNRGVNVLLVYGDPGYYGRFGFQAEVAQTFIPPYPLQYPFGWQGLMLQADQANNLASQSITCVQALCKPELW